MGTFLFEIMEEFMIKAVIFDMDGVLIDSEMEYLKFDLEFAKKKNPEVTIEQLFGMVGSSREDCWRCMERAVNNGQSWEELRNEFRQRDVFMEMDYRAIFREEAREVLHWLKAQGYQIALASSTQMDIIEQVLRENEISSYFQVVVTGAMFKRSKPDPEIYHYTAEKLGVKEEECFVIEDSTFGVTAASRAGMKVAAVIDERFGFDQSLADYRIGNLREVMGLLDGAVGK